MESDIQIRDSEQSRQGYTKVHLPPPVKESTGTAIAISFTRASTTSRQIDSGPHPGRQQHWRHIMDRAFHFVRHHLSKISRWRTHTRTRGTGPNWKKKEERRKQTKQQRIESAMSMPTLDEELKSFKAIVRHIMRREADSEQSKWFKAEGRNRLRRLAKLGIIGHQLAIVAYCKVSKEERDVIIENLLKQKVGSSPKTMKIFDDYKKAVDEAAVAVTPQQDDQNGTGSSSRSSVAPPPPPHTQFSMECGGCHAVAKKVPQ